MTNDLDTVVSTMDSVFSRQDSPAGWLWQPLLRQLARGEPLTIADLAAATGREVGNREGFAAGQLPQQRLP